MNQMPKVNEERHNELQYAALLKYEIIKDKNHGRY